MDAASVPVRESFAPIALRLWYSPYVRYGGGEDAISVQIAPAAMLIEQQRADRLALILSWIPVLSLNGISAVRSGGVARQA